MESKPLNTRSLTLSAHLEAVLVCGSTFLSLVSLIWLWKSLGIWWQGYLKVEVNEDETETCTF